MINHRMQWFLILQGFLFAGIGFSWEKNTALCIVFSSVGVLSSLSVGFLLRCGIQAIASLEDNIEQVIIGKKAEALSPLQHFLLPWHFLPVTMALAWIAMGVIKAANIG